MSEGVSPADTSVFDAALAFVLGAEGGETNDPSDPGGHTRYGIAQNKHPEVNVSELTLERAKDIYRADYWRPLRADELPRAVAYAVFDCAVNQGTGVAASLLQQALGVQIDGQVGPRTLGAARRVGNRVLPKLGRLRVIRYVELVRSKPVLTKYLNGWVERVFAAHQAALEFV